MAFPFNAAIVLGLLGCPSASGSNEARTSNPAGSVFRSRDGTPAGDTTGDGGDPPLCRGNLDVAWQDGTNCRAEVPVQVHRFDADTFVLRQSLCTNFEGPFMYLLFGEDRVLLQDTGTGDVAIEPVVRGIIEDWLAERNRTAIELVVVNSHGHGDHIAGNRQFADQPGVTVVGASVANLAAFFGFPNWPQDVATFDLGGRILDVVPIPGHQSAHTAIYDHATGLLLTGDTLYPGRLYIADFQDYVASIDRLVAHVRPLEVCHVMGTHIEMSERPGVEFPVRSTQHPQERELGLDFDHLLELQRAVQAMAVPGREVHDDFIVVP